MTSAPGPREAAIASALPDYRRWLYAVAHRLDRTGHTVDDLAQEGSIAMWRAMGTWNPAKGALPSWLTKAAELRMTQIAYGHGTWLGKPSSRGSRPVEEDVILDNYDNPDTLFDAVDSPAGIELAYHEGEIAEALDALSPAQRRYVVARFWLGLDPASRTPEMQRLCALVPEMRRGSSLWLGTTGQRGARQRLADALAHLAPAA